MEPNVSGFGVLDGAVVFLDDGWVSPLSVGRALMVMVRLGVAGMVLQWASTSLSVSGLLFGSSLAMEKLVEMMVGLKIAGGRH